MKPQPNSFSIFLNRLLIEAPYLKTFPYPSPSSFLLHLFNAFNNYILILESLPYDSMTVWESVRNKRMICYFYDIVRALIIELYFPKDLHSYSIYYLKHLIPEGLEVTTELEKVKGVFNRLYDLEHPLRHDVFMLNTLPIYRKIYNCPVCSQPVVQVVTSCVNVSCPAILKEKIKHWVSRDALDIKGIGEKLVHQLVDKSLVHSVADLYKLTEEQLCGLERIGKKSAQKLVQAIRESKNQPWSRVLYGLGIRHVGSVNAQLLAEKFTTVDKLVSAKQSDIEGVYGIGVEIAQSVYQWSHISANQNLIICLKTMGLQLATGKSVHTRTEPNSKIAGKTFVITGTLPTLERH